VCEDREREPDDRRHDAKPQAPRLARHAKEGAEDAGEHRVATQTEKREARPELEPPRCNPMLRETLGYVQRSLDKVEPNADERSGIPAPPRREANRPQAG
jgi:hypothetical protein